MNEITNHSMLRLVLASYVGKSCIVCKHVYESVDDIIERDPVRATKEVNFDLACADCWKLTRSQDER